MAKENEVTKGELDGLCRRHMSAKVSLTAKA